MPFTGADFNTQLDLTTDQAFTGYYTLAQKNLFVKEALNKAVEAKVITNDRIQVQDDLFGIFKTNATYTPVTNTIDLIVGGTGIDDYHHVMNVKAQFVEAFSGVYLSGASNTTPIRITTSEDVNLRTGEQVLIASVTGNTNANGTRYVKRLKPNYYELYSDVNLNTAVAGNGVYSGTTGSISRVNYNTAYDMKSNRKFSTLNAPTIKDPYYEIADTVMKIYPLTKSCTEVSVDYISIPPAIDVGDNTDDLLEVFTERFIYFIISETARIMGMAMRDVELNNQSQAEIIQQP